MAILKYFFGFTILMHLGTSLSGQDLIDVDQHPAYTDAISESKNEGKLVLILFNGNKCSKPKQTKKLIESSNEVRKYINENYVFIILYTDDNTELDLKEQFQSDFIGIKVDTEGKRNIHLEMSKFGKNYTPYFVIIDSSEQIMKDAGFMETEAEILEFLSIAY